MLSLSGLYIYIEVRTFVLKYETKQLHMDIICNSRTFYTSLKLVLQYLQEWSYLYEIRQYEYFKFQHMDVVQNSHEKNIQVSIQKQSTVKIIDTKNLVYI